MRESEDYRIKDISLAEWGHKEIDIAETEMPGLMALRDEYADAKPLAGAKIVVCQHVTTQTAVLIKTLTALGGEVRCVAASPCSTQDYAAAAIAASGVPVFAWKGMSDEDHKLCLDEAIQGKKDWAPTAIVDDSAKATKHLKNHRPDLLAKIDGVSEQTTTGVRRFEKYEEQNRLKVAVINVNDSVTKSKFDNLYGSRESFVDGIKRVTDVMIAGKIAVVCGYGDVGKGCAQALKNSGSKVYVTEIDPICAMQAAMDGYEVCKLDEMVDRGDMFVTATNNKDVIIKEDMARMKQDAIVCNMGSDAEIKIDDIPQECWTGVKPQVHHITFPDNRRVTLLAKGMPVNLCCAHGHPSFVMSMSFANQVLAQIEIRKNRERLENRVYVLPKHLDEKVARLHLDKVGANLTQLTPEQAKYLNVPVEGPYKAEHYRY